MRAQQIADFLSARLIGNPGRDITAAASLSTAGPADLSFIEDAKYLDRAAQCRAGAVLAGEFAADGVPGNGGPQSTWDDDMDGHLPVVDRHETDKVAVGVIAPALDEQVLVAHERFGFARRHGQFDKVGETGRGIRERLAHV